MDHDYNYGENLEVFVIDTSSKLASLACYLLSDCARFSCCSLIAPTFSVGHFYQ